MFDGATESSLIQNRAKDGFGDFFAVDVVLLLFHGGLRNNL